MASSRFTLPSAVHLFLQQENSVLFSRRYNTGYEDGSFSVPAGHLNGGETVREAMIREAQEEIGITIKPDDLHIVGVMHRKSDDERIDWFLHAANWKGTVTNMEVHKCDLLEWFPINQAPQNLIPYVLRALENFRDGRWFDSFGFAEDA